LETPFKAFINAKGFVEMLNPLKQIQIESFLESSNDFNKEVEITWDNNIKKTILDVSLTGEKPKGQLQGQKTFFYLTDKKLKEFLELTDLKKLLSQSITPFDITSVEEIKCNMKAQDQKIILKNLGTSWDYVSEDGAMKTPYNPTLLAHNLLLVAIKEYRTKQEIDTELKDYIELKYRLLKGKNKDFSVLIGIGKNGGLYATLDDKLFGLIEATDVEFLNALAWGEVIPEKNEEE